jgi:hypothetical protein
MAKANGHHGNVPQYATAVLLEANQPSLAASPTHVVSRLPGETGEYGFTGSFLEF